jgi:membrane-associated phospholipid phosphatase
MKTKFLHLFFLLIFGFSAFSFAQESSASEKKDSAKAVRKDSIAVRKDSIAQKKDSIIQKKDSTIAVKKDSVALIPVKPNVSYIKSYWVDSKAIASAPFHWSKKEWIAASVVVGGGIILYAFDDDIQKLVLRNRGTNTNAYLRTIFDPLGSGLYSIPSLGILYGYGAIWHNDKAKETSLKGLEAFLLTGVVIQIIKEMTQRHRPYADDPSNPYLWNGPFNLIPDASFPSGHSAAAFAVATVISYSYKNLIWVPIICYSLATLTAMARVVENNHWASDAFVGSAIGFAIGRLVYHGSYRRLEILPVSAAGQGVSLIYHL